MKEVLKDTPEYEVYSENEVKLTNEEMKELGMVKCGGCCCKDKGGFNKCCKSSKEGNISFGDKGCSKGKKCCNGKK